MAGEIKIMAVLSARPGKADALLALLSNMVAPCRAEAGNLRWDIWQDQAEPGRFILDELYTDNAAITAHRATAHFRDYVAQISDLAERSAFVCDAVEVG